MKKFSIFLIAFLSLLLFGCSKREAISYGDFKSMAEKNEYTVVEVTEQFKEYDYIKGAYLAVSSDTNYQVEFYLFEDDKGAKSFYDLNKEIFESQGSGSNVSTTKDSKNFNKYTLITDKMYNTITRIDNTVVYSTSNKNYKDNVIKLVNKLGY